MLNYVKYQLRNYKKAVNKHISYTRESLRKSKYHSRKWKSYSVVCFKRCSKTTANMRSLQFLLNAFNVENTEECHSCKHRQQSLVSDVTGQRTWSGIPIDAAELRRSSVDQLSVVIFCFVWSRLNLYVILRWCKTVSHMRNQVRKLLIWTKFLRYQWNGWMTYETGRYWWI